jgi:MFS family permease
MREELKQLPYYRWLIFGVTVTGTFMAVLDSSIVNVALPLIAADFRVDLAVVQWVVSAYYVALVIGACFAGIGAIISLSRKGHVYLKIVK